MKILKKVAVCLLGLIVVAAAAIMILRWVNGAETARLEEVKQSTRDQYGYAKGLNRDDIAKSPIPGVDISEIKEQHASGYHFKPQQIKHKGVIVLFGGSEGSVNPNLAALLSTNGYEVFAMYFFGKNNLQKELVHVPIEVFEPIKSYVASHARQSKPLTVVGQSKGAELGLLLASYYPKDVDNLVLYAPSAYTWQGLSNDYSNQKSSWTYKNKELPFLKLDDSSPETWVSFLIDMLVGRPLEFAPMYDSIIQRTNNKSEATISLKPVKANLLMFAGGKDSVWPSSSMAQTIKQNYPQQSQVRLEIYPDAGHVFFGPPVINGMRTGGDYQANEAAKTQSDKILLQQLESWTKNNERKV